MSGLAISGLAMSGLAMSGFAMSGFAISGLAMSGFVGSGLRTIVPCWPPGTVVPAGAVICVDRDSHLRMRIARA